MKQHRAMAHSFSADMLSHWTNGTWNRIPAANSIGGFGIDSREIHPGEMFIALTTEKNDGHHYLSEAMGAGASAALVSRIDGTIPLPQLQVDETRKAFHAIAAAYRKTLKIPVIAIAGSYGKTTTRELLSLLLGREEVGTSRDNENNTLGVPLNLLRIDENRHRYAVLEAGIDHPGEMEIISQILQPQYVIFTALSHKHLAQFPSQRALLQEKLKIAQFIAPQNGKLVCPQELLRHGDAAKFDGPMETVARLSLAAIRENVFPAKATGKSTARLFYATEWDRLNRQLKCHLRFGESNSPVTESYELPILSEGFAHDFALCRELMRQWEVPQSLIRERLKDWKALPLRGQVWENPIGKQFFYVDCYNSDAKPLLESMQLFLRQYAKPPITWVLGSLSDFGAHSGAIHHQLGEKIPVAADQSILLLGEEIMPLRESLLRRGFPAKNVHYFESKSTLAEALRPIEGWIYIKGSRLHGLETLINFDKWKKWN